MRTKKIINCVCYVNLICMFFLYSSAISKPSIEIDIQYEELKLEKHTDVIFLGILDNIPGDRKKIAHGIFVTGAFTLKCDISTIKKLSEKKAKKLNCDSFFITNLIEPNLLNTCYKCEIVFCIAKNRKKA